MRTILVRSQADAVKVAHAEQGSLGDLTDKDFHNYAGDSKMIGQTQGPGKEQAKVGLWQQKSALASL